MECYAGVDAKDAQKIISQEQESKGFIERQLAKIAAWLPSMKAFLVAIALANW